MYIYVWKVSFMEFVKPRRRIPFRERIRDITEILNKQGEVSVKELFLKWKLQPQYIKTLLFWTKESLPYAEYDEENGILYIPERKQKGETSNE